MLRLRVPRYLSTMLGRLALAFPDGRSYVRARVVPLSLLCLLCLSCILLLPFFFSNGTGTGQ